MDHEKRIPNGMISLPFPYFSHAIDLVRYGGVLSGKVGTRMCGPDRENQKNWYDSSKMCEKTVVRPWDPPCYEVLISFSDI